MCAPTTTAAEMAAVLGSMSRTYYFATAPRPVRAELDFDGRPVHRHLADDMSGRKCKFDGTRWPNAVHCCSPNRWQKHDPSTGKLQWRTTEDGMVCKYDSEGRPTHSFWQQISSDDQASEDDEHDHE